MHLRFTVEKSNIAFMDITYKENAPIMYAFSGTTNLTLPELPMQCMFEKKEPDYEGDETVKEVLTGSKVQSHDSFRYDKLIALLVHYQALIDCAAFLRSKPVQEVARDIHTEYEDKNVIYFDDKNDTPLDIYGKDFDFATCIKQNSQCFYFYDQKHTVGTDTRQPSTMHGLCLVSSENRLTEVAQAMFRLRKLKEKTHTIKFLYLRSPDDKEALPKNGEELYKRLLDNDIKYLANIEPLRLLQTVRVMSRIEDNFSPESYKVRTLYSPLDGDSSISYQEKYQTQLDRINETLLKKEDHKSFKRRMDEIEVGASEKQKQQQQEKQRQQERQREQQKVITNTVYSLPTCITVKNTYIDDYNEFPSNKVCSIDHNVYITHYVNTCFLKRWVFPVTIRQLSFYNVFYYLHRSNDQKCLIVSAAEYAVIKSKIEQDENWKINDYHDHTSTRLAMIMTGRLLPLATQIDLLAQTKVDRSWFIKTSNSFQRAGIVPFMGFFYRAIMSIDMTEIDKLQNLSDHQRFFNSRDQDQNVYERAKAVIRNRLGQGLIAPVKTFTFARKK
jgi:hypothetical protein